MQRVKFSLVSFFGFSITEIDRSAVFAKLALLPFRREQIDTNDAVFFIRLIVPPVFLVPDEINQRDQINRRALRQSERLSHVLDWNLSPRTGREIFQFEWTVLNTPEPGHLMPQCLEQSSDFTVFPLGQDHFQM